MLERIFTRKCCREAMYPQFGKVKVYMAHDENMGKCLFADDFITPNMPKLHYAIDFSVKEDRLILKENLSPKASKFHGKTAYVFEKRDGFNLLFYLYRDEVIPKTRLKPIATGKTAQVIDLPEFPKENVEDLVKDGFIPIMEVWGSRIEELDIMHGPVNFKAVQEKEGLQELNAEVIAIMKADYDNYRYEFLRPEEMIDTASLYGLRTAPLHDVMELTPGNVRELMSRAEKINQPEILLEGFVAHCFAGNYGMFKIKPCDIMTKDVIASKTIPQDRILLEISKILLETDVFDIARNPAEYIDQLSDFLREDFKLSKKMEKKVRRVFAEAIARELLWKNPDLTPEMAGRSGISGMFIGFLRSLSRDE